MDMSIIDPIKQHDPRSLKVDGPRRQQYFFGSHVLKILMKDIILRIELKWYTKKYCILHDV